MHKYKPPDHTRAYLHIGNLEGHADHEGEISEIKVVRIIFVRKFDSAYDATRCQCVMVVIQMRVTYGKNSVEQCPGK